MPAKSSRAKKAPARPKVSSTSNGRGTNPKKRRAPEHSDDGRDHRVTRASKKALDMRPIALLGRVADADPSAASSDAFDRPESPLTEDDEQSLPEDINSPTHIEQATTNRLASTLSDIQMDADIRGDKGKATEYHGGDDRHLNDTTKGDGEFQGSPDEYTNSESMNGHMVGSIESQYNVL
ncbi:hypothetical protein BDN71DRAFT_1514670 [Pleurotus eryngii]|uniref:Uncharacterized protein n=1 Tax=Pleurotus eryngii TaxID=5323 RepID=A0A9P5ZHZ3_PLEER|nr:hypothetical protein BDN71DRAFT_1514670 [Pleurotus eryngii]